MSLDLIGFHPQKMDAKIDQGEWLAGECSCFRWFSIFIVYFISILQISAETGINIKVNILQYFVFQHTSYTSDYLVKLAPSRLQREKQLLKFPRNFKNPQCCWVSWVRSSNMMLVDLAGSIIWPNEIIFHQPRFP